MRILVVYGSKRGSTAEIGELVAQGLTAAGHDVEVGSAGRQDPAGFDAVVVGGAVYMDRWHRAARRFVTRNAAVLRGRPVWLFSSGPLDDSARAGTVPPVGQVLRAMEELGARGHMTFGGRLAPDATGFPASAMAKERAGDWRDTGHILEWTDHIASELAAVAA